MLFLFRRRRRAGWRGGGRKEEGGYLYLPTLPTDLCRPGGDKEEGGRRGVAAEREGILFPSLPSSNYA